jgi:3-methyladenine DNA glycosylase AlkD
MASAKEAIAALKRRATKATLNGMARYAIPSDKAFGVAMRDIQAVAKECGRDHDLAMALWKAEWYEARTLACYVAEVDKLTAAEMESWCRDFDNWAICDTACFVLFDKSPHAWKKVDAWVKRKDEYAKRAGFALLACLALHDKKSGDEPFAARLALIEKGATDDRNFVKKGISWALRSIARRSPALRASSKALAKKLLASESASARWIARDLK